MKTKIIGLFGVGLLALGLSGCATNQVRTQGIITAVNVSGQTIQIKTDQGQSQTLSVAANSRLLNADKTFRNRMTLDEVRAGEFLAAFVQPSTNSDGGLVIDWGDVFNQRPGNLRDYGNFGGETPAAISTTASTTGVAPAAPIPSFQTGDTIPTNKAVIYFYRPDANMVFGSDVKLAVPVKVNGQLINALRQGGYFACLADPGAIELGTCELPGFMAPKSVFSMTLQVQAGQAYYIKGAHGKGMGGRAHLASVSPETGASEMANCQLMPPLPDELRKKIEGGGQ